uniref:Uncharacterized protein n=2 Tax=Lutzomyia longipalpis TaxID=7200 RepID=A0A1B0CT67_LUTLO
MHHIMLHYIVMKIKAKKAYKEIQGIYGTKPMSKRHFYRLYEKYKPLYMEKKKRKDCVCCEIIPKKRPPSNPERILEFYRSHPGMPVREMAEKLGISTDIIYRRIRMADGVKREQKKRVQKKNKTKNPENTNGTNGTSNETTQADVEGVE